MNRMRPAAIVPFVIAALLCAASARAAAAPNSISQYGITWTFDAPVVRGQFVGGDWWVVGPVKIVSVSPAPTGSGADARNGSVVNPTLAHAPDKSFTAAHYDGRMSNYSGAERVAFPLALKPGDSLVSTESVVGPFRMDAPGEDPEGLPFPAFYRTFDDVKPARPGGTTTFLKNAAILTCVAAAPPAASFRPPYVGKDKPIYSSARLPLELLPNLPVPRDGPPVPQLLRCFERPWTDLAANYFAPEHAAAQNMAVSYGREFSRVVGDAMLACCCRIPADQKRKLCVALVQRGIDLYAAYTIDPDLWQPNGGFKIGRKAPILFAARMLDVKWQVASDKFQEDVDHYFGDPADSAEWLWTNPAGPGGNVMRRLAGARYEHVPPAQWHTLKDVYGHPLFPWDKPEGYGRQNSRALVGELTAARLLGLRPAWRHDALFAYIDRWMTEDDAAARRQIADAARANGWDALDPPGGKLTWTDPQSPLYRPFAGEAGTPFAREMYLLARPINR